MLIKKKETSIRSIQKEYENGATFFLKAHSYLEKKVNLEKRQLFQAGVFDHSEQRTSSLQAIVYPWINFTGRKYVSRIK